MATRQGEIFVGREAELAALRTALDDGLAGRGRLVMLVGEPGIGKTRTAEELATVARERGAEVLWGRCPEERGAPPYWPWAQVIGAHAAATDPSALLAELGRGAGTIAEMAPGIAEQLSGLEPPQKIEDPESARFRLFDSIASFLKRASQARPLVIVFDNLHWADGSSLRLLEFIASEVANARILLLGTYRDVDISRDHPLFQALGSLARQRLFERVPLRGLDEHATGRMIALSSGADLPHALIAKLRAQTDGNPLFIGEIVRLLGHHGMLTGAGLADPANWEFRVPESVREVIGRRLNLLSKECNEVLTVAAVVGREFNLTLLALLFPDTPEDLLLVALEEAAKVRVIEELPRQGWHQFSHALVQRTLADELSLTRRVRLHARVGAAMETMYGADAGNHAAELAYHFAQSESATGPEKTVLYSVLAGDQALDGYAYEEAVRHFKLALSAKGEGPPDVERAEILAGLGRAQAGSLERTEMQVAVDSLAQAVDCYLAIGERQRAVAVSAIPLKAIPGSTDVASLLERVLPYLDDQSPITPILLARYGEALGIERNDVEAASTFLGRAERVATALNDSEAAMNVSAYRISFEFHHGMFEGIVRAAEVRRHARELGNTEIELIVATFQLIAQVTFGDAAGLKETMRVASELTQKLRSTQDIEHMCHLLNSCHALFGDWDQVRSLLDRGLRVAPEAPRLMGGRVFVEYATGNAEEGARWADRLLAKTRAAPATANWACVMAGRIFPAVIPMGANAALLGPARAANEAVVSDRLAPKARQRYGWPGLGMIAAGEGDSTLAARVYQPLMEPGWTSPVTNLRVMGLVAKTMNRHDLARIHFEDNLDFCRQAGFKPELAWTCHDYAEMLLSTSGKPDTEGAAKVKALLDEGEPLATQLGMTPLAAKLAALRGNLVVRRGGRPDFPDGLTEREVEVLRLVAAGKSNRDIGEALVISENTVIRHVSNIFAKARVSNRVEAASYAARQGLLIPIGG